MKKFFTLLQASLLLFMSSAMAAIVDVDVVNFQFNPANVNVTVGDVVRFHFMEGFHNATSSGAEIPSGAPAINSGDPSSAVRTYDYNVAVQGTYNYYCEVHGDPSGGGMAGTINASGALPVTFAGFDITAAANKKPVIMWQTVSEQQVAYFSLRSSGDGKRFSEIAKVPAKGSSNSVQNYSYTDEQVSTSYRYIFYEIVTVDKDGTESFSPIKMFKTANAAAKLIMQLAPNPITRPGQLMIQFNAEKAGSMPVNVFDINGKRVIKIKMAAMPGLNNGHLHVCDLSPGIYTLQFAYEGLRETRKIVVE